MNCRKFKIFQRNRQKLLKRLKPVFRRTCEGITLLCVWHKSTDSNPAKVRAIQRARVERAKNGAGIHNRLRKKEIKACISVALGEAYRLLIRGIGFWSGVLTFWRRAGGQSVRSESTPGSPECSQTTPTTPENPEDNYRPAGLQPST